MSNYPSIIRCTHKDFADLTPKVGQVVLVKSEAEDPGVLKMWSGTEWVNIEANTNSEITMTTYDINKQIIHQLPDLDIETIASKREMITDFCNEMNNKFYMLLCRDTNYYTLLHRVKESGFDYIADVVTECAETQGAIKSIEKTDGAIEIWVDNPYLEDATYVMYFFPYDGGVEVCQ